MKTHLSIPSLLHSLFILYLFSIPLSFFGQDSSVSIQDEDIHSSAIVKECQIHNQALFKPTRMSCVYGNSSSDLGVDGITFGETPWSYPDIVHTCGEAEDKWWEVDLGVGAIGQSFKISEICIYNRFSNNDFLVNRLRNYYLFISCTPFGENATVAKLLNDSNVYSQFVENPPQFPTCISIPEVVGQYVRIMLQGKEPLHFAELEVYGCPVAGGCGLDGDPCSNLEQPVISPAGPFLVSDEIQQLAANPLGGIWGGAVINPNFFTVNGVFNEAASLALAEAFTEGANLYSNPLFSELNPNSRIPGMQALDPRPSKLGIAFKESRASIPSDNFFENTDFKGGFGENLWIKGWTALEDYGFLVRDSGSPIPNRPISNGAEILVTDNGGSGTGTTTWTSNNTYVLEGRVYVNDGDTLTIEAGTVIKGRGSTNPENASLLIVARGGYIIAEGTAERPIIFTSEVDDLSISDDVAPFEKGLWGGVIVLGKAVTNLESFEGKIEGLEGDERGTYGGNDDDDDSGILKYISIRHGGAAISPDHEINGLTLAAVGRRTTIEYVEVYANQDDGFEWLGGTANSKYLVAAFEGDDSFDYDEGFRGKGQFWFAIQDEEGDRGGEHDGGSNPETGLPFATPRIFNATYVGAGSEIDNSRALTFRDNAGGSYQNSIFAEFGRGVDIEFLSIGTHSFDRFLAGQLQLTHNIFWDISEANTGVFDPGMGVGTYRVTYSVQEAYCVTADTLEIEVLGSAECKEPQNLALGKASSQSSTYGIGVATLANDGNRTGDSPWSANLQHTQTEMQPWWQVDLGEVVAVQGVKIFNRKDASEYLLNRLNNFWVFISTRTLSSSLQENLEDPSVEKFFYNGDAGTEVEALLSGNGRYVQIQLSGQGILHMAEVEVYGCQIGSCHTPVNLALEKSSGQSSIYGMGVASLANDGNTMGGSPWTADLQHTLSSDFQPWWEVDLGQTSDVRGIRIYNRTTENPYLLNRLNNFWVFLSEQLPTVSLQSNIDNSESKKYFFAGNAGAVVDIPLSGKGRFVRVQKSGGGPLHMAEVQVLGCGVSTPDPTRFANANSTIDAEPGLTMEAYPNPFTNSFTLQVRGEVLDEAKVELVNALGQRVEVRSVIGEGTITMGRNLSKGIYFLHLMNGTDVKQLKVVKAK